VLVGESSPRGPATATPPACRHCGTPNPPGEEFCCAGCAYVHRLIHTEGLEAYYHIKDSITVPATAATGPARDFAWLTEAQTEAETQAGEGRTPRLTVAVQGLSCAGCVWLIERLYRKHPGAGRIEINAQTGQARLSWQRGECDLAEWAGQLQRFNYLIGPPGPAQAGTSESRGLARRIGLCTAFAMNIMLFTLPTYFGMEAGFAYADLFTTLAFGFATLSLLAGGGYFMARAGRALREGAVHIDLPISIGIAGAYAGSFYGWLSGREEYLYFDFVGMFILLMLVGRWAQVAAVERNQRRLLREQPTPPRVAVIAADGGRREVAPEALRPGDCFEVPPTRHVPVAGVLASPEAACSLAWINGESAPRVFRAGQPVPAGAENVSNFPLQLTATEGWEGSLLAELLRPVERRDSGHGLVDRVIQGYLIGILLAATAGLVWWLARTGDPLHAGAIVTAVLVVSCPCAIGLAWPLADEMATVALRRRGVFVRREDLWARLGRVRRLVFDKTGTLTRETPVLGDPMVLAAMDTEARAALGAMVRDNPHPLCRALHEAMLARGGLPAPPPGEVGEVVGRGVTLGRWRLGRADWAVDGAAAVVTAPPGGRGDLVLARAGEVRARFAFADVAREDARTEVAALGARGLDVFILSGDHGDKVAALAREVGLPPDHAYGDHGPREKAAWLEEHAGEVSLMLGDGANDSLAFDHALVRGTPVIHRGVLEAKADFYYLGRGIGGLRALFEVNDARRRALVVLIVFSVTYNVVTVATALAGLMSPLVAAVLMPLSSLTSLAIVATGLRGAWRG